MLNYTVTAMLIIIFDVIYWIIVPKNKQWKNYEYKCYVYNWKLQITIKTYTSKIIYYKYSYADNVIYMVIPRVLLIRLKYVLCKIIMKC